MPPPSSLSVVYATDEDVVVIAGADYQVVASRFFRYAAGSDGVFSNADPWTLTSASVPFAAQGVAPNMMCQLLAPAANFPGSGDLLAIETIGANSITLRRAGEALGVGQPPAPAGGLSGVKFLVTSMRRQIEDVAFQLNERFSVDPNLPMRTPGDIYNQRILRRMTVYTVLMRQYAQMNRESKGDFADKIGYYAEQIDQELATAQLRWGPQGQTQATTGRFSTHFGR